MNVALAGMLDANPDAIALQDHYSGMGSLILAKVFGDVQSRTQKLATFLRSETVHASDKFE